MKIKAKIYLPSLIASDEHIDFALALIECFECLVDLFKLELPVFDLFELLLAEYAAALACILVEVIPNEVEELLLAILVALLTQILKQVEALEGLVSEEKISRVKGQSLGALRKVPQKHDS